MEGGGGQWGLLTHHVRGAAKYFFQCGASGLATQAGRHNAMQVNVQHIGQGRQGQDATHLAVILAVPLPALVFDEGGVVANV